MVTLSGKLTNRSVTITAGGTAQDAATARTGRKYLLIQNPSGSGGTAWVRFGADAVQASPSIEIQAGGSYESPPHFCPNERVSVIHPTTSAKLTILEG